MLHRADFRAQRLRHCVFAVSAEHFVEVAADLRRQRAVIPRPNPRRSRRARLFRHPRDFVALFEIKGKPHHVPAALERLPILRVRRIFQDFDARHVLPQKSQPERDSSRHAEAPRKPLRRVLAKIVVEPEIPMNCRKEHSRHGSPLRTRAIVWPRRTLRRELRWYTQIVSCPCA